MCMKRKLFGILMCFVLLAAIPLAAGITIPKEQKSQPSGALDVTILRGFVLFKRPVDGGRSLRFFALRVHYTTIGISGYKTGVLKFKSLIIPNSMRGMYIRLYIFAIFHGDVSWQ